jgi:UDP-2,3-diacylglucosamine pyrophosphatase LpxH
MPRKKDGPAPLAFPTVFISDMHLGKGVAQVEMLLEFLNHIKCDQLFIVGDGIEGWGLMGKKHRKFREMELRVFDRINAMAHAGVAVTWLPGNHDENLRAHWHIGKAKLKKPDEKKESRKRRAILGHTYSFKDTAQGLESRIRLVNECEYVDPAGRRMRIIHGDQFDPRFLRTAWGKALSYVGNGLYDVAIELNGMAVKLAREYAGKNFSLATVLKKAAKDKFKVIDAFERAVMHVAQVKDVDGLVCGHIHHAEIHDRYGAMYVNSGDWVESCTAAVHDEEGNWRILDWDEEREKLGLGALPVESDKNPSAAFRGITQKQMLWIQRLWPGRKLAEKLEAVARARDHLRSLQDKISRKAQIGGKVAARVDAARQALESATLEALPY